MVINLKETLFLDSNIASVINKSIIEENKKDLFKTTHYLVGKNSNIKKRYGDYFVLNFKDLNKDILIKELSKIIRSFLNKYKNNNKVLIIGLGNDLVISDSLGTSVTNKLIATNHYNDFLTLPKITLFNPLVVERTGIDSFKLIKGVVEEVKPDVIIMIDSMYTKNSNYLNKAIEINDTGVIPGALLKTAKKIDRKTFNIPIITIGMPLVLKSGKDLFTSVNIKEIINISSDIIASSLKKVLL